MIKMVIVQIQSKLIVGGIVKDLMNKPADVLKVLFCFY